MDNNLQHTEPFFSVVIPCYNAGKFLQRTLKALSNQTFSDFEVVIVDDGCTDNSTDIANTFCSLRNGWNVFSFSNGGMTVARNRGLAAAKGEYVYFLDADDYIIPTFFETVYDIITSHSMPDIVKVGFQYHYGDVSTLAYDDSTDRRRATAVEKDVTELIHTLVGSSAADIYEYYKTRTWKWKSAGFGIWAFIFRRQLLTDHDICFVPKMNFGEDKVFTLEALIYAKKVVETDQVLYFYMQNEGDGLMNRTLRNVSRLYKDKLMLIDERERFRNMYRQLTGVDLFEKYQGSNIMSCLQMAVWSTNMPYTEALSLYKNYVSHPVIKESLRTFSVKGAPLKIVLPIMMLKCGLPGLLITACFCMKKLGLNIGL